MHDYHAIQELDSPFVAVLLAQQILTNVTNQLHLKKKTSLDLRIYTVHDATEAQTKEKKRCSDDKNRGWSLVVLSLKRKLYYDFFFLKDLQFFK